MRSRTAGSLYWIQVSRLAKRQSTGATAPCRRRRTLKSCRASGERCDAHLIVDIELATRPPRKRLLAGKKFKSVNVAEGSFAARHPYVEKTAPSELLSPLKAMIAGAASKGHKFLASPNALDYKHPATGWSSRQYAPTLPALRDA